MQHKQEIEEKLQRIEGERERGSEEREGDRIPFLSVSPQWLPEYSICKNASKISHSSNNLPR